MYSQGKVLILCLEALVEVVYVMVVRRFCRVGNITQSTSLPHDSPRGVDGIFRWLLDKVILLLIIIVMVHVFNG